MANSSNGFSFEEVRVKGSQLIDKVREIIDEGSAKRLIIKKDERVLMELPLSFGVGGAAAAVLLAPSLAAVGAIAALVTDVSILIERKDPNITEVEAEIIEPDETP